MKDSLLHYINFTSIYHSLKSAMLHAVLMSLQAGWLLCPCCCIYLFHISVVTCLTVVCIYYDSVCLDLGSVIKGWDTGVKTMKKGEVAILTCSPDYGYGEIGSPPKIPPNSRLVFEIELFYWKGESVTDVDDGVTKVVLQKGTGYQTPNRKAEVESK